MALSRPITDPALPPEERLRMLRSTAMMLSPMHPRDWMAIQAEYDEVEAQQAGRET